MKYCPKCGEENNNEAKFCKSCGKSLDEVINQANNNQINNNKESLGTASIVLGIIALIFALFCFTLFPIFLTIPLSLVGLILGIVNKVKKGKKFAGIILNGVAIFVSILFFIIGLIVFATSISTPGNSLYNFFNRLYNSLERETSDNYVSGIYNCKSFDGTGAKGDYIVRFELNKDYTFLWAKYGDTKNNYVKGTYAFTDLHKINNSGDYKYYNINIDGDEYYNDGKKQDQKYASEYEFGITGVSTKKQGILMNVKTYNMYYCYEE